MSPTKVEWAQETLNPLAGCTKVSPGCKNCVALSFARRHQGKGHPKYAHTTRDGEWSGTINFMPSVLDQLAKWRKPRRIFMQIMGDLFHPKVEDEWIDRIWYEMAGNPRHTYIMLTKRPENVVSYIERSHGGNYAWPDNWWMGTTCENQEQADNRIPILLSLKAQLSFVSVEPMLEPVDLRLWTERHPMGYFDGYTYTSQKPMLHWVICGAETGPGKRDMFPGWAHDLGYTCGMTGVPFFFKKDSQGNHELGGLIFEQYPEVSE